MERNSLCSKFKTKQMHEYNNKLRGSSWDYNDYSCNNNVNNGDNWKEGDMLGVAGFSWPPRSYTCSFCKREFRSAQALGGHMNVHRRDRARLRLLSPTNTRDNNTLFVCGGDKNLSLDLNPSSLNSSNPTTTTSCPSNSSCTHQPNLSSIFTKFPHFTSTLPPICPLAANVATNMSEIKRLGHEDEEIIKMKGHEVLMKGVRLELEIGLISQSKDQELDLELRLGYT